MTVAYLREEMDCVEHFRWSQHFMREYQAQKRAMDQAKRRKGRR